MNMTDTTKIADDIFMVPWGEGNGVIRREVWVDQDGRASRYHLAYINEDMQQEENGRVLGFEFTDNELCEFSAGKKTAGSFSTLEAMEVSFEIKWNNIPKLCKPPTGNGNTGGSQIGEDENYSELKGMKLVITKGTISDFFKRGKELASKLDRGERPDPEKIVMMGRRADLCHSHMPKNEWASLRNRMAAGDMSE